MNMYSRKYLTERFLAQQQTQLAEDAKLPDPADAYEALLDELSIEPDRDWTAHQVEAA